jgi:hypothetical protein
MPKVLAPDVFRQHFDNSGDVLNGGLIYTYAGGTSTPATTWTGSAGDGVTGAQTNPIVLDSVGREPGGIWITKGTAYKFILKTSAGVTLDTVDNIVVGEVDSEVDDQYEIALSFNGTPTAQQWMGGVELCRTVTFDVNFDGSRGDVITDPSGDYVIAVQKNGVEVGTITISSAGVFAFATTGGATVSCIAGDKIDFIAPDTIGSAADFSVTLVGTL